MASAGDEDELTGIHTRKNIDQSIYFIKYMLRTRPLRQYIFDRLYHRGQGYFCRDDFQVGQMKQPLDFKQMLGRDDYQRAVFEAYPKNAWLTPSELFRPYYGMTVASYLAAAHRQYRDLHKKKRQMRIVQVGAGLGSAAQSILHYMYNYQRQLYNDMTYTIVEISPQLCQKMRQKMSFYNKKLMKEGRLRILNQDIMDYREEQPSKLSYLLFFEVLDNLPHDRVVRVDNQKEFTLETRVDLESNVEQLVKLQDPLIKECLQYYMKLPKNRQAEKVTGLFNRLTMLFLRKHITSSFNQNTLFLPTYFLNLLHKFKRDIPNNHLVISDFDNLFSRVPGIYAPVVSKKGSLSHQKKDYETYLVNRGEADIFFPTDFELLRIMHQGVMGKEGQYVKTHEFVKEFSRETWAETQNGFNPLKEEFINTSFFITKI